jgi:hypothetical protein
MTHVHFRHSFLILLRYTQNILLIPPSEWIKWHSFSRVNITISVTNKGSLNSSCVYGLTLVRITCFGKIWDQENSSAVTSQHWHSGRGKAFIVGSSTFRTEHLVTDLAGVSALKGDNVAYEITVRLNWCYEVCIDNLFRCEVPKIINAWLYGMMSLRAQWLAIIPTGHETA